MPTGIYKRKQAKKPVATKATKHTMQQLNRAIQHPMSGETALAAVLRDLSGQQKAHAQLLQDIHHRVSETVNDHERRLKANEEAICPKVAARLTALERHDAHHSADINGIHAQLKDLKQYKTPNHSQAMGGTDFPPPKRFVSASRIMDLIRPLPSEARLELTTLICRLMLGQS